MDNIGFCVKCNRDKPKGQWEKTELKYSYVDVIKTSKGHRRLLRGTCPECGSKVTAFIKAEQ